MPSLRKLALVAVAGALLCLSAAYAGEPAEAKFQDPEQRDRSVARMTRESDLEKTAAWDEAIRDGWAPKGKANGRLFELMAIHNGLPYVYITTNVNAAISTAANLIRNVAPYNLNGAGLTVGIWDGGAVRSTHQELTGRVTIKDGGSIEDHATHVAGTIGASGVNPSALGMAPSVLIHSYEWTNDAAEMASRAMSFAGEPGTIQLSNHSYSYIAGWFWDGLEYWWYGTWGARESDYFGQYDSYTQEWDDVCYNAPYYLPFSAASNDRGDTAPPDGTRFRYYNRRWRTRVYDPSTDPYDDGWDNGGFDTIPPVSGTKNGMTVGAVNDAVSGGIRSLAGATMTSFSCWGPTDDGRIKPDVVANGASLFSCIATSNTSYDTYSGTSMATPNAMGSAALLIEYYGELFPGRYMRASTIKGLIIHTADDLGRPGPDYSFGWGLMNAKAAADLILRHHESPAVSRIAEDVLTTSESLKAYPFRWDGTSPIRVTICWTDPPASPVSGLDNPAPRLINDLDLRVVGPGGAVTYQPYVLNPSSPLSNATTGDNTLDNLEQVFVASPTSPGTYTVRISHKGTLTNGAQDFSLLISGAADVTEGATILSIATSSTDPAWMQITWESAFSFTIYWTSDPPGGPQTWNAVDGAALADIVDNGDGTWTWTDKGTDPDMGGLAPGSVAKRFYRISAP